MSNHRKKTTNMHRAGESGPYDVRGITTHLKALRANPRLREDYIHFSKSRKPSHGNQQPSV